MPGLERDGGWELWGWELFGIVENGLDLAKGVVVAEPAFHSAEGGAADLADNSQDGRDFLFRH